MKAQNSVSLNKEIEIRVQHGVDIFLFDPQYKM